MKTETPNPEHYMGGVSTHTFQDVCDQRDELLAACKAAEIELRGSISLGHDDGSVMKQIRAAIAKAEKGAE